MEIASTFKIRDFLRLKIRFFEDKVEFTSLSPDQNLTLIHEERFLEESNLIPPRTMLILWAWLSFWHRALISRGEEL